MKSVLFKESFKTSLVVMLGWPNLTFAPSFDL